MGAARIEPCHKTAPAGVKAYYAGGFRILIDGIPTRIARRPSANTLTLMGEATDYNMPSGYCPFSGRPLHGYAACECGRCSGTAIVLPKRALDKLRRTAKKMEYDL